jgi:hypothetical protein
MQLPLDHIALAPPVVSLSACLTRSLHGGHAQVHFNSKTAHKITLDVPIL